MTAQLQKQATKELRRLSDFRPDQGAMGSSQTRHPVIRLFEAKLHTRQGFSQRELLPSQNLTNAVSVGAELLGNVLILRALKAEDPDCNRFLEIESRSFNYDRIKFHPCKVVAGRSRHRFSPLRLGGDARARRNRHRWAAFSVEVAAGLCGRGDESSCPHKIKFSSTRFMGSIPRCVIRWGRPCGLLGSPIEFASSPQLNSLTGPCR